jgi:hypothetical protein
VSKRGRPPKPLVFRRPEWVPLLRDAFFQARDCAGSRVAAAQDLYQDLLRGRLTSAIREFDANDVEVTARILPPDYWQQFVLQPALPSHDESDPGIRLLLRDATTFPFYNAHFLVQRTELDRFYPLPGDKTIALDTASSLRRRKGVHDWFAICGEIARRCHDKTGRLVVPQNENKLAGDVLQWCEDKWERQPPVSDLREAVKAVCAALRGI